MAFHKINNISSSSRCRRVYTIRLLFSNNISILSNNSCIRMFFLHGIGASVACIGRIAYNPTPFAKPGKGFICDLLGERRSIGQHNLDNIWEFLQQIHLYQYPSIGEPGHSCCGNVTVDWLPNHAAKFQKTLSNLDSSFFFFLSNVRIKKKLETSNTRKRKQSPLTKSEARQAC